MKSPHPVHRPQSLQMRADDASPASASGPSFAPPAFQLKASAPLQMSPDPHLPVQRMTCFAHGFVPQRDFFGNSDRSENGETVRDFDYNGYWQDQNSDFDRAEKEGDEQGMAENEKSIGEQFAERLKDDGPTYYFDGSAGALSQADTRMEYGRAGADQLDQGNITRAEGAEAETEGGENASKEGPEPVVIVGHSMGAAYAAGLAARLKEINDASETPKYDIKSVYYLAPHQPNQITHPSGLRGVQYSHERDNVSSFGLIPFFSRSRLERINGVSEYLPFEKKIGGDKLTRGWFPHFPLLNERGGHDVGDHDYIFDEYGPQEAGHVRSIHD